MSLRISPLTSGPGLSLSGSWSPDGSQLAFDFTSSGTMDVAVMSLGGGEPRVIAGEPYDEAMPRWSPDGSKIAFLADAGEGQDVFWVPPTGGAAPRIASTGFRYLDRFSALRALGSQPWSPDGRSLVFSRLEQDESAALYRIELATGEETRLTAPPPGVLDFRAAWSPDGERIAFHREAGARLGSSSFRRTVASRRASSWTAVSMQVRVGRRTAAGSSSPRSAGRAWTSTISTSRRAQSAS